MYYFECNISQGCRHLWKITNFTVFKEDWSTCIRRAYYHISRDKIPEI